MWWSSLSKLDDNTTGLIKPTLTNSKESRKWQPNATAAASVITAGRKRIATQSSWWGLMLGNVIPHSLPLSRLVGGCLSFLPHNDARRRRNYHYPATLHRDLDVAVAQWWSGDEAAGDGNWLQLPTTICLLFMFRYFILFLLLFYAFGVFFLAHESISASSLPSKIWSNFFVGGGGGAHADVFLSCSIFVTLSLSQIRLLI